MKRSRLIVLILIFFLSGGAIIARLFFIQILRPSLDERGSQMIQASGQNLGRRGDIFIQDKEGNLYILATTKSFLRVFINPLKISSEKEKLLSQKLFNALSIPQDVVDAHIAKKENTYEVIADKIDVERKQELKDLFKGFPLGLIGIEEYQDRFYPYGQMAAHILGFVGFSDNGREGLYGLEKYYENVLSQKDDLFLEPPGIPSAFSGGMKAAEKTNPSPFGENFALKAQSGLFLGAKNNIKKFLSPNTDATKENVGASLVLSLDLTIQSQAEKFLDELIKKWSSPSGSVIVMRPQDGAILAMAAYPTFDPNNYSKVNNISTFINPVVQSVFEPGSIMKPFTLSSGIDTGAITPQTTFIDTGSVQRNGYTISNAGHHIFGKRNMIEVLQFSINTGAVFVVEKVGGERFLHYLEDFGFGAKTGVDLPGEVSGDITNLDNGRAINLATAAFGQGISATPIQILTALSAIANGGKLMKPFLAQRILYPNGDEDITKKEIVRQAISAQTSAKLTAMMVEVIEKGYSKKARVQGYSIAGKSGTAQIPDPKGGYLDQTIHSFVGFAPAYNPAFIVLVKLDEPLGIRFASDSIAPYFSGFIQSILNYYNISPDKNANTTPDATLAIP